ncbi:AsnC family transcriptional regulator [Xylophilus rhododendri]|uniref:AsnC family transcriptional regulator n=1 Tax=Xylophilus rhododendri TaxID=2697032 RepID=A0A857JCI6_9BURK|nr:Lrp/AsnC family transcriptional regulator [Xylophilus rhododendri]QHJ00459.1 AsnC family transcriptional regulator [Xylophilus rhododendri]
MGEETGLDAVDLRVLRALQAHGRASFEELSALVALSPSATQRRVRRLEEEGFIAGYSARVNPARVGIHLTAYINVRLEKHRENGKRGPADEFAAAVQAWPEVVDCMALTGEMDYLLRVLVADMEHFSAFVMDKLLRHPAVQDCKSSFVLSQVKASAVLPI